MIWTLSKFLHTFFIGKFGRQLPSRETADELRINEHPTSPLFHFQELRIKKWKLLNFKVVPLCLHAFVSSMRQRRAVDFTTLLLCPQQPLDKMPTENNRRSGRFHHHHHHHYHLLLLSDGAQGLDEASPASCHLFPWPRASSSTVRFQVFFDLPLFLLSWGSGRFRERTIFLLPPENRTPNTRSSRPKPIRCSNRSIPTPLTRCGTLFCSCCHMHWAFTVWAAATCLRACRNDNELA